MAERFVNGLYIPAPTDSTTRAGVMFSRWLVEWLTQVVGWSVVDSVTGSHWSNVLASGSDGVCTSASRFTAASASFSSSDVGGYLTLPSFSAPYENRAGIYKIASVVGPTAVELEYRTAVHSDGLPSGQTGRSWRLWRCTTGYTPVQNDVIVLGGTGVQAPGYTFHLHLTVTAVDTNNNGYPSYIISPFASWNAGSHAWDNAKRTSGIGHLNYSSSVSNNSQARVYAHADTDHATILCRIYNGTNYAWHFIYLGEIDAFYTSADPKPCVVYCGSTNANDTSFLIGYGMDSNMGAGRGQWLAEDDLTSVAGYLSFAHISPSSNTHWLAGAGRRWSMWTKRLYRQKLLCESRTASHEEFRGSLKKCWTTARDYMRGTPFGANHEFLHVVGGMTIPWNGSKVWSEWV